MDVAEHIQFAAVPKQLLVPAGAAAPGNLVWAAGVREGAQGLFSGAVPVHLSGIQSLKLSLQNPLFSPSPEMSERCF